MKLSHIQIQDEKHWHQLRSDKVGASEMGALFNAHEYCGYWQLYRQKRGELEVKMNNAMELGKELEDGVAKYVERTMGRKLTKATTYHYLEDAPIGCTPDYFDEEGNPVQIKVAQRRWEDLPMYVELQALTEMMCTGKLKHTTYVLTPFYDVLEFNREAQPDKYPVMIKKSIEFMNRVKNNIEPTLDEMSAPVAATFYAGRDVEGESLNMIGNDDFKNMCVEYSTLKKEEKNISKKIEVLRGTIIKSLDTAQYAVFDGGSVSAKTTKSGARTLKLKMENEDE